MSKGIAGSVALTRLPLAGLGPETPTCRCEANHHGDALQAGANVGANDEKGDHNTFTDVISMNPGGRSSLNPQGVPRTHGLRYGHSLRPWWFTAAVVLPGAEKLLGTALTTLLQ